MKQDQEQPGEKIDRSKMKSKNGLTEEEKGKRFLEKVIRIYPNCVVCKEKSEKFASFK